MSSVVRTETLRCAQSDRGGMPQKLVVKAETLRFAQSDGENIRVTKSTRFCVSIYFLFFLNFTKSVDPVQNFFI